MRITKQTLANYRKEVDAQADIAGSYVMDAIEAFYRTYPNADTAASRNVTIEIMKTALPNFCEAAGTLSADFFDEIIEALGIDAESRLYDTMDYSYVDQKVRYFAKFLNEGDTARFKKEVVDVTRYFVKRSAYENMVENCVGNQLRYARVPSGFETCAFCFMLASRGFVYHSERKAGDGHKYHNNCDCIVIPGSTDANGNPRVKIDGYDPQKMFDNWEKCAKTIGANPTSTSDEVRKAIMREVGTRDWHWLYTGNAPKFRAEYGADPDDYEIEAGRLLREENGFNVVFRKRSLNERDRRSDTFINGIKYELKNPRGSGWLTVHNQIKKNLYGTGKKKILNPQSNRVIISNVRSEHTFEELISQAQLVLSGKTRFTEEELSLIEEIIILDRDGRTKRIKR